jgi:hypothetical protein
VGEQQLLESLVGKVRDQLTPPQRELVGKSWYVRMRQEHLAVSTFSRLAIELLDLGSSPGVLELCTRAAADEVRHLVTCREVARLWLGQDKVPHSFRGVADINEWAGATREQRLALDLTEECCVGETLISAHLARIMEVSNEPHRAIVRALLEDEVHHGRLGWAYLADLRQLGVSLDFIAPHIPVMLDRQVSEMIEDGPPDDLSLEPHGFIGIHATSAVYRNAMTEMMFPAFEKIGIDTGPARAHCRANGWLP